MHYLVYNYKYFLIGALGILMLFRIARAIIYKELNLPRELVIIALALFVAFLSTQTFEPYQIRVTGFKPSYNFVPLHSIQKILARGISFNTPETKPLHFAMIYINLLGNVLVFMPVGFISPFLQKEPRWYKSLLAGLALSMTIEITQLVMIRRSFDVDDLLLNGLGTLLGYGAFKLFTLVPPFKRLASKTGASDRAHGWIWAGAYVLSVIALSLAIFLHQYRIYLDTPWG